MPRPKSDLANVVVSPLNRRLIRFFKREPVAAKFVGETEDGDEITWPMPVKKNQQCWQDGCSVLRQCWVIRAFDDKGSVLRQCKLDRERDPELQAEAEAEAERDAGPRPTREGAVRLISVDVPRLVDNIARNMREVASEAARQNSESFKEGFTALVQVVNVCLNLLVKVEERLEAAEDEEPAELPAAGAPNLKDQMAMMAMQRAFGGPNPPPNGQNGQALDVNALMRLAQTYMSAQPQQGPGNAE